MPAQLVIHKENSSCAAVIKQGLANREFEHANVQLNRVLDSADLAQISVDTLISVGIHARRTQEIMRSEKGDDWVDLVIKGIKIKAVS